MGSNPVMPEMLGDLRVLIITCFALGYTLFILGVFGGLRTAATKLPVPHHGFDDEGKLFPFDIGPTLYPLDGMLKKAVKIVIYSVVAVLGLACLLNALYIAYRTGDSWFAWTAALGVQIAVATHVLALLMVTTPFVRRAFSHANRFNPSSENA